MSAGGNRRRVADLIEGSDELSEAELDRALRFENARSLATIADALTFVANHGLKVDPGMITVAGP